jgi:hypothetical protein
VTPPDIARVRPRRFRGSGGSSIWRATSGTWNLDWYAESYVDPCADCADLTAASSECSGAAAITTTSQLVPPYRNGDIPEDRYDYLGLRCARAP